MFHIVKLLLFSGIVFAAVYQFSFNKNDMMIYDFCLIADVSCIHILLL